MNELYQTLSEALRDEASHHVGRGCRGRESACFISLDSLLLSAAKAIEQLRMGRENAQRINDNGADEIERLTIQYDKAEHRGDCYKEDAARIAAGRDRLQGVLRRFLHWAEQKCPCKFESPDPCPLCGASVASGICKAADSTLPSDILRDAREALDGSSYETESRHPDTERLDWLDTVTERMNRRYGTVYGWRYDINHNRAALTDHNLPALTIRQAIDECMATARPPETPDDPIGPCSCGRVRERWGRFCAKVTCADGSEHTQGGCNSPSKASEPPPSTGE